MATAPARRWRRSAPRRIASTARYQRSYASGGPEDDLPAAVPAAHHEAFRSDGRGLVASLVAYLDADDAEPAPPPSPAPRPTRTISPGDSRPPGLSLTESVGLFVAARRPFLAELGSIARRRALGADRLSAMFEDASALLDRLLIRLVAAHQQAT